MIAGIRHALLFTFFVAVALDLILQAVQGNNNTPGVSEIEPEIYLGTANGLEALSVRTSA